MQIQELLFSQGFGTRRVCAGLIQLGHVQADTGSGWAVCNDPHLNIEPEEGWLFQVQNQLWQYHAKAYLVLNKPSGTECSHKPSAWPSVYSLLPMPLRQRPVKSAVQGVQAVGRLDQDTSGLLLLTDDGQLLHRLASPRHHVPKTYQIQLEKNITQTMIDQLLNGLLLHGENKPVRAVNIQVDSPNQISMVITEGKYHQVKRMLAAVGNQVNALHRSQIGGFELPADLFAGQWRWLTPEQLSSVCS
jgi:16S rRNA pseudouridine516 synthase